MTLLHLVLTPAPAWRACLNDQEAVGPRRAVTDAMAVITALATCAGPHHPAFVGREVDDLGAGNGIHQAALGAPRT